MKKRPKSKNKLKYFFIYSKELYTKKKSISWQKVPTGPGYHGHGNSGRNGLRFKPSQRSIKIQLKTTRSYPWWSISQNSTKAVQRSAERPCRQWIVRLRCGRNFIFYRRPCSTTWWKRSMLTRRKKYKPERTSMSMFQLRMFKKCNKKAKKMKLQTWLTIYDHQMRINLPNFHLNINIKHVTFRVVLCYIQNIIDQINNNSLFTLCKLE